MTFPQGASGLGKDRRIRKRHRLARSLKMDHANGLLGMDRIHMYQGGFVGPLLNRRGPLVARIDALDGKPDKQCPYGGDGENTDCCRFLLWRGRLRGRNGRRGRITHWSYPSDIWRFSFTNGAVNSVAQSSLCCRWLNCRKDRESLGQKRIHPE